ncbi:MAG: hypothetical protein AB7S38_41565 [Vulcanimicrobiota bacterium]
MKITAVVRITLEPSWYRLAADERTRLRAHLAELLLSRDNVRCRWFDSAPWMGRVAEFFVCEFSNLHDYWKLWNDVREHPIFLDAHARLDRVTLGMPNPDYQKSEEEADDQEH